jgi:hypothetical protein
LKPPPKKTCLYDLQSTGELQWPINWPNALWIS